MTRLKESALLCGYKKSLVAILSEPYLGCKSVGVILINAGSTHRIGPNRIYVRVARYLATKGFIVCRPDLSNNGDSPSRGDGLSLRQYAPIEIKSIMEELKVTKKIKHFVLIGICTGADIAFETACIERDIKGVVLINGAFVDPNIFPTVCKIANKRIRKRYYMKHLFSLSSWMKLMTMKSVFWRLIWNKAFIFNEKKHEIKADIGQAFPIDRWKKLSGLGTNVFLVFSEGSECWDIFKMIHKKNLKNILIEKMSFIFIRDVDHSFTLLSSQNFLIKKISDWLEKL